MDESVSRREFGRVVQHFNGTLEKHRAAVNQHAAAINRLNKDMGEVLRDKHADHFKGIVRAQLAESQRYGSVIVGVGFAGYFGLWSLVKSELPAAPHALSGLLIAISLCFYVGWEIYRMAGAAFDSQEIERLLEADAELDGTINGGPDRSQIVAVVELRQARLLNWWPMVLAWTVGPAVLGAAVMLWSLTVKLLQAL